MRVLLFLAVLAIADGCKTKKTAVPEGTCKTSGTVRDFDGLDGCGYLIELKDGKLLNPVKMPEGFVFKNGQTVRFDYTVLNDAVSVCMAESQLVQIDCIIDPKQTGATDCSKISNPFAVEWMSKAIDLHNPVKIIKYQKGGAWVFAFKSEPNNTFLYDCEGHLLCKSSGDEGDACHKEHLNFVTKGKTIWQGEGVWD